MATRDEVQRSLYGGCRDVYIRREPLPERYHGRRARLAMIELHLREGRHSEAHALVIAELDGTAG
jgi:hypothetical protein